MAKKAKAPNPFTGRWRIVSMSAWDEEFIIWLFGLSSGWKLPTNRSFAAKIVGFPAIRGHSGSTTGNRGHAVTGSGA
jgi:hypothetical protein